MSAPASTRGPRLGTFEGEPAVFMRLQDGSEAVTTPEGYAAVLTAVRPCAWLLNSNGKGRHYVRASATSLAAGDKRLRSVAALISGADRDQQTGYRNGNRLDLRPCNLYLEPRVGRRAALEGPGWEDWERAGERTA